MPAPREPSCTVDSVAGRIWTGRTPQPMADGFVLSLVNGIVAPQDNAPALIVSACFNVAGELLATLDARGHISVFYLQANRFHRLQRAAPRAVAIAFSPLRRTELLVSLERGPIECIDVGTRAVVGCMRGHTHPACSLICHPTRALLLSSAADMAILWSTSDFSRVRALPARSFSLQHAAFSPSDDALLTCAERTLTYWNLDALQPISTLRLPAAHGGLAKLRACAITPDSRLAVGGGDGGWLAVWELPTGTLTALLLLPDGASGVTQISPLAAPEGAAHVALTCADGAVRVIDARAPAVLSTLHPAISGAVVSAAVDPSMRHLAATCADGTAALYQLASLGPHPARKPAPLRSVVSGPLFDDVERRSDARLKRGGARGAPAAAAPRPPPELPHNWERRGRDVGGAPAARELHLAKLSKLEAGSALLDPRRLSEVVRSGYAFPSRYRVIAWRFALQLPANVHAHAALLAKGPHAACVKLQIRIPLADRRGVSRLERLLSCLAHWCPCFAQVPELPATVYPNPNPKPKPKPKP